MRVLHEILVLGLFVLCLSRPVRGQSDHVLITEFVVTPTAGEFIEIFNPTNAVIDLTNYYLTDDVTSNNNDYVKVVNGAAALTLATFDFMVRFPAGASIAPGEAQTVAFSDTAFHRTYGKSANYEMFDSDSTVANMIPIWVRANAGLTNAGEVIVLFTWDGVSDLVQDVDYVVWGNKAAAVDKSGLAIDGPDADSTASTYRDDTPVADQTVVNTDNDADLEPHDVGDSAARITLEKGETRTGGNGITGHDETSEDLSFAGGSWAKSDTPTPGTVPEALTNKPVHFMSMLNAQQVLSNPQVSGGGGGFFILNEERDELQFYLSVNGLSGAITAAHFRNAEAGDTGPVVRTITADFQGEVASGEWKSTDAEPLTPALVALLRDGKIHVDIRTAAYPDGEIRGQILPGTERRFVANLTGAQEVPSVVTTAAGAGKFTLNAAGSELTYDLAVSGLSGAITGAHFHNATAGANGNVVRDITASFSINSAMGDWTNADAEPFTPALVAELLARKIYVNVHTAAHSGGEIRGQLREGEEFTFLTVLEGKQENPEVITGATGGGRFFLNAEQTELSYLIKAHNLSGPITAAHLHNAARGSNGAIVRDIFFTDGTASGIWSSTDSVQTLTPLLLAELLAGNIYVNIHTAAHPGGEIRGQLISGMPVKFSARLEGAQEVPPVVTSAAGFGAFELNANGDELAYELAITNLSSGFRAAHFHNAPSGANGGVVRDIPFTGATAKGAWRSADSMQTLTPDLIVDLLASRIYVNVHSNDHPGGEIRGQVTPGAQAVQPIAIARQGANGNSVTVEGIVTRGRGSFARVQDATAGITLFATSGPFRAAIDSGLVRMGDRLRLTGMLAEANALKVITSVSEFTVLSRDNTLPEAQSLTLAEIARNGEAYESELIRVEGLLIERAGDLAFGAGKTYVLRDASDTTGAVTLRIPASSETEVIGKPIGEVLNFTGVLSQFSVTHADSGYQLQPVLERDIESIFVGVEEQAVNLPAKFALHHNFPNPFNPTTMIRYDLPKNARVKIIIYNLLGEKVRTLVDAHEIAGFKQVSWDGLNDAGARVASGVYVYRLATPGYTAARKFLLLK